MSSVLDQTEALRSADPGDMLAYLRRLPEVAAAAFARGRATRLPQARPRQVVICGMGGSAISGDLARNLLYSTFEAPMAVVRHLELPANVGPDDLVIALSYSGNTAETMGCLEAAIARGVPCAVVTAGGHAAELAARHALPRVELEPGWMPRAALGELYFALLGLLCQLPGGEALSPDAAIARLILERAAWDVSVPLAANRAKQIATELAGKTPVVFGVFPATEAVAMRWKAQFNENSKVTALTGIFPELTHNEIVNLAFKPHPDHVMVLLRDPGEAALIARQVSIARDLMAETLGGVIELVGSGEGALERQLSLCYLGDWVSVYMALAAGIDPTPVEAIFGLKARMAEEVTA